MAIIMESTSSTGFKKVKDFAKELVEAFTISQADTRVSVITYGGSAKVDFRFNSAAGSSLSKAKSGIDKLVLVGGGNAGSGDALQLALDNVFIYGGGSRQNSNKVRTRFMLQQDL